MDNYNYYVKVEVEYYDDLVDQYFFYLADNFDVDIDDLTHDSWVDNVCYGWLYNFIVEGNLLDDLSHRFHFFLKNDNGDIRSHFFIDLPLDVLRLIDVFKSKICEIIRVEGWKEAD